MKIVTALSNALSFIEKSIIVLLLSMMVLLAFLQLILRNVFSIGFLWADPLLRHSVLWIGFLGASLAAQQEKHINIDLITRFLPPRLTNAVRILTNAFASAICCFLSIAGWTFVTNEQSTRDMLFSLGAAEFPIWWFQLIIPIGFGLIAFRFFLKIIEHIIGVFNPAAPAHPSTNVPTLDA